SIYRQVRALCASGRAPDLIAPHFALHALPALLAAGGRPTVVHFHGPWARESALQGAGALGVWAKHRVETFVYRRAAKLIVLSAAFARILTEDYGIAPERIVVIPGGIEADRFPFQPTPAVSRAKLGWPDDGPVVVCVRRLVKRMGIDCLLEAWKSVRTRHPAARLMIGGRGPEREALEQLAHRLGLGDSVRFLGFITEDRLPDVYGAADLSIVPTQDLEGFGLITLESLACGTPVLVTPVGGLPEAVSGLEPRLVLADRTAAAISAGLEAALSGPAWLPARRACRDYIERGFTWPVIAARVAETYHQVAAEAHGAA
ncbi:MAG: glycosyl transferase family 1, partial [Rhodocyclaceae bacterium]|nr:glycosyl transferase family 1 [Rhodocyclaceae bacterium]